MLGFVHTHEEDRLKIQEQHVHCRVCRTGRRLLCNLLTPGEERHISHSKNSNFPRNMVSLEPRFFDYMISQGPCYLMELSQLLLLQHECP